MMETREILDRIFKDPATRYELTEFENLGKPIHEILSIFPKTASKGRDAGKTKYYLKSFIPFSTGKEDVQVFVKDGKANPEEIVRQLWVYKLIHQYQYRQDEIELEKSIQFGTEVGTKAADIVVYTDSGKETPKIIIECKKPKRRDGIEQLKSYMNAEGAPVAVWSNGSDNIILYRPYPKKFDDTLFDIPKRGQVPKDVLEAKKTLLQLKKDFNFKKIIQDLEELVLADSGKDEFNEIFKLIFAKIWDEKEALEHRKDKTVEFGKSLDPDITYDRINHLFKNATEEWPGIFEVGENIKLTKRHLQVCIGPIEGVRLMGSNLRIMDDAFEYLLPTEAKKKKGQFFTPRHVVEMCVRMLNPKRDEYVMDPACGSGGFLLHAMDWCYPAKNKNERELRKFKYAGQYLWGIDFETRAAKTSRALMLIAGDGHTNIFGPDVNSLDPSTWYETGSGQSLMHGLRKARLTANPIPENERLRDEDKAWEYFEELRFDVILANPPFAGEMKDRKMLAHYDLARPALKRAKGKAAKEERDVLFIERILKMLKPGGRAAIVLPQGKFNNSSLAFIREWILKKARLLAVVGLHPNTFKPHTGTKTSALFIQKYSEQDLADIAKVHDEVAVACPDYGAEIQDVLDEHAEAMDVSEEALSEPVLDLLNEIHAEPEDTADDPSDLEEQQTQAEMQLNRLRQEMFGLKDRLFNLDNDIEAMQQQQATELEALKQFGQEGIKAATAGWKGTKTALTSHLKPIRLETSDSMKEYKVTFKKRLKQAKTEQKQTRKTLKADLKRMEKELVRAELAYKLLSTRGKLELLLADTDSISTLKERWIAAEVAKRLDYPIFMAVSERGGKNNSGDYEYLMDEWGGLVYFPEGHPQDGQPAVNQDLVNFDLCADDLGDAAGIPEEQLCVAEAFVCFAQEQRLDFWRVE